MRRYVLEGWLILGMLCLLATAIVAGGLWTLQNYTEHLPDAEAQQEQFEKYEAYCYQTYDDPSLQVSRTSGEHGGLHCAANEGGPHLHEVTDEALEEAYRANMSNTTTNFDGVQRYRKPTNTFTMSDKAVFGAAALAMLFSLVYFPYREGKDDY